MPFELVREGIVLIKAINCVIGRVYISEEMNLKQSSA
jgi:hypothetical protein